MGIAWPEWILDTWFKTNYNLLGFSEIRRGEPNFGDYIGIRDGIKYRIELESTPSQFFLHKPKMRKNIDIIICFRKNYYYENQMKLKELTTKEIIEVKPFVGSKQDSPKDMFECRTLMQKYAAEFHRGSDMKNIQ